MQSQTLVQMKVTQNDPLVVLMENFMNGHFKSE